MIDTKKIIIFYLIIGVIGITGILIYEKPIPLGVKITDETTYFAEIDSNGNVLRVLVVDQEFIDSGKLGNPDNWVQTYKDDSKRKHYAGKSYTYNKTLDAFIPPKTSVDSILDETNAIWVTPVFATSTQCEYKKYYVKLF